TPGCWAREEGPNLPPMECYYGDGAGAVGVCSVCGRGLWRTHLAESGDRLACKDRHEADALAIRKTASLTIGGTQVAIGLLFVAGVLLAAYGVWEALAYGLAPASLPLLTGTGFVVF